MDHQLRIKLHWHGGEHTTLEVVIASVLNRIGVRTARIIPGRNRAYEHSAATMTLRFTAKVNAWNVEKSFCTKHRAGWASMTVVHLIKDGVLPAKQCCVGAAYVIREADLELPAVRRGLKAAVHSHPIRDKGLWNINDVGR
jgi:hypothetical protein